MKGGGLTAKYNYFEDRYEDPSFFEKIWLKIKEIFEKIVDWFLNINFNVSEIELPKIIKDKNGKKIKISLPKSKNISAKTVSNFILGSVCVVFLLIVCIAFSSAISKDGKKDEYFEKNSAKVCSQYLALYGQCNVLDASKDTYDLYSMSGICFIRRIDFNNDKSDELLIVYMNSEEYYAEVWGTNKKKEFARLYSGKLNKSKNVEDGRWVTILNNGSKYYIGEHSENNSEIKFFKLSSGEFKEVDGAEYDFDKKVYKRHALDITDNLEFIKLTYITKRQAENIYEFCTDRLEEISSLKNENQQEALPEKTELEKRNSAYSEIAENYAARYGKADITKEKNKFFITGLGVVKLLDFDGDNVEELLLVYERDEKVVVNNYGDYTTKTERKYYMEVFAWNGNTATRVFQSDALVTPTKNKKQKFVLLEKDDEKTNLCTVINNVDEKKYDSGTFTARRNVFENGKFSTEYDAKIVSNYGYKKYYLNGERIYNKSEFAEKGYEIPYFFDSEKTADDDFETIFVQTDENNYNDLNKALSETESTIKKIAEKS